MQGTQGCMRQAHQVFNRTTPHSYSCTVALEVGRRKVARQDLIIVHPRVAAAFTF
jgi:hypothetical protein